MVRCSSISRAMFFQPRIVLVICRSYVFKEEFQDFFSSSIQNIIGILLGIVKNLQAAFNNIAMSTVVILLIHEHGRSF